MKEISKHRYTDLNLFCSYSEQAKSQPHPGQNPQSCISCTVLYLAPARSGLLVQVQWCSITATWHLDGAGVRPDSLQGGQNEFGTICICLCRCFEKGGLCMLEKEKHEENMGGLVGWFVFPNLVS